MHEEVQEQLHHRRGLLDISDRAQRCRRVRWRTAYEFGGRLFLNAGAARGIVPHPVDSRRRLLPAVLSREQYRARESQALGGLCGSGGGTRLHASFGMGLRPPSGFELAFTNNPALKPERTRSVDAGVEQKLFDNRLTAGRALTSTTATTT